MALLISDRQYHALMRCVDDAKKWHQHLTQSGSTGHGAVEDRRISLDLARQGMDVLKMQRIRALKDERAKQHA